MEQSQRSLRRFWIEPFKLHHTRMFDDAIQMQCFFPCFCPFLHSFFLSAFQMSVSSSSPTPLAESSFHTSLCPPPPSPSPLFPSTPFSWPPLAAVSVRACFSCRMLSQHTTGALLSDVNRVRLSPGRQELRLNKFKTNWQVVKLELLPSREIRGEEMGTEVFFYSKK